MTLSYAKPKISVCLASANLEVGDNKLTNLGAEFFSPTVSAKDGMTEIAVWIDSGGRLIELIQGHFYKWRV